MYGVPDGLEEALSKRKNQNVLHRLFAHVVIDAINLLSESTLLFDGSSRVQNRSRAKGFSMIDVASRLEANSSLLRARWQVGLLGLKMHRQLPLLPARRMATGAESLIEKPSATTTILHAT